MVGTSLWLAGPSTSAAVRRDVRRKTLCHILKAENQESCLYKAIHTQPYKH